MSRAVPRAVRMRRLTVSVLQALAVPSVMLLTASAAWAGCDSVAPVAGQTVTCDANAPNPQTVPVTANGAAGITVTVASTAQLQQSGGSSAISLVGAGGHLLSNLGTISSVGGVAVQLGGGSRVENSGSISTGNNTALQFVGAGDSVLVNRGTISGRTGVQFGAAMIAWTCRLAASAAVCCRAMAMMRCCWTTVRSTASTRAVAMTR